MHVLASQEGEALHAGKHRGPFGLDILILNVSPSETGRLLSERGGALAGGARHLDETKCRVTHVRTCPAAFVASRTLEAPAGRCRSKGRLTVGKKSKRDRQHRLDAHDRDPRARAPVPDHPGRRNGPVPPRVDLPRPRPGGSCARVSPVSRPRSTRSLTRGSTSTIGSSRCFPRLRELARSRCGLRGSAGR